MPFPLGYLKQLGLSSMAAAVAKRPPTAYFVFANAHRDSAKQELLTRGQGPKVSVAQVLTEPLFGFIQNIKSRMTSSVMCPCLEGL